MSAAAQSSAEVDADRAVEGWRYGHRAALFALRQAQHEATNNPARTALSDAIMRVDAIERPPVLVILSRAERLEAAIRAALALNDAEFGPEAVAVLKDALR
jgi:hypothetical protein